MREREKRTPAKMREREEEGKEEEEDVVFGVGGGSLWV